MVTKKGNDRIEELLLSLEEAFYGGEYQMELVACPGKKEATRSELVRVGVPAGIENNQSITIKNRGYYGKDMEERNRGDLQVVIKVKPHPVFERRGRDLYSEVVIDEKTAKNGGVVCVNTIDGPIHLAIEPETKNNTVIGIKEKGMPSLMNKDFRGDYYLTVCVKK